LSKNKLKQQKAKLRELELLNTQIEARATYLLAFLRHKSLRNTEIYINIERTLFEPGSDEFTVKVVEKPEGVKALLEVGFEYVCQKEGLIFLRKRK